MVKQIGNVQFMQRINRVMVFNQIRQFGPIPRPELARRTNLSLSSITNIVNYLLECGLVTEEGHEATGTAGRRAKLLRLRAGAMSIIAVNIEPNEAQVARTNLAGGLSRRVRIPLDEEKSANEILTQIAQAAEEMFDSGVRAIGVAVSGHVMHESGEVVSSILRWKQINVKHFFEERFGVHVYVCNNSKTKALWAANQNRNEMEKNTVFLDLALGLGIISFFDGQINESVTGELGHTTVMKDGPRCFCGNRGCLELVCSTRFVMDRCRALGYQVLESALDAFIAGNPGEARIFTEVAEYLGIGIANIISLFEPSLIIINQNELIANNRLYEMALDEAKARAFNLVSRQVRFLRVQITPEEALRGVSQYVTDRLFALDGPDDIL